MYPPLGDILTTIYSICFPIADYKRLPEDQRKTLDAFLRRIQRLEEDDSLTNFTIGEFLSQGAENLDPLFPTSNIPIYIGLMVHMFLKDYTNKTVLDFPTYYERSETVKFLYEAFIPRVLDFCEAIYEQFDMLSETPRLPQNWYLPKHGNKKAPFIETLSWAQARYESSTYGLGKNAEARLGITFDATKKRINRWKSGKNLPNIHECIHLLGIPSSDEKTRLFIYVSIVLSKIYDTFPASIDIDTSLRSISRFGIDTYLHSINRVTPQELCGLSSKFMELLGKARKKEGILKSEIEMFLNSNSTLIVKYNYQYMAETLWGRYYLLSANDPKTARNHYAKAFEEGKYRGGRYQKQISNDYLYCLRILDDRRAFRRVYFWLRLYESFFANAVTMEEIDFEKVYENNYKSIPFLFREENGEIIYQP